LEVAALAACFRGLPQGSVMLGSAKSNIGHCETAAGVAGLIKTVLMLQHGTLAPTRYAAAPSPRIAWAETPFALVGEARPWQERRVAGISSFGIGGTNAHVVVGAAAPARPAARMIPPRLVISAHGRDALAALQKEYRDRLAARPEDFPAICAAALRRPRHAWWLAAHSAAELDAALPCQGPMPDLPAAEDGPPLDLPLTPFRCERHWIETPEEMAAERALVSPPIATPFAATLYPVTLDRQRFWLAQHVVAGRPLLPAALHLALFLEAAGVAVADLAVHLPWSLEDAGGLQLWRAQDGALRLMVGADAGWQCLAEARLAEPTPPPAAWPVPVGETIDGGAWAATMREAGLDFGPAFRLISGLRRHGSAIRAELDAAATANKVALLDAGLQALGAASGAGESGFLPAEIRHFTRFGELAEVRAILARLTVDAADARTGDILWLDAADDIVAAARGVVCRRQRDRVADMLYRLAWRPALDRAVAAPYAELEAVARRLAHRAVQDVANPARPALARLLRPHAMAAEAGPEEPDAACAALIARYPQHRAEIALVARCGGGLVAVLKGEQDPLDLLFAGDVAAEAYRLSPLAAALNRVAAGVAAAARPRRVIEIGGGTAATTLALRDALLQLDEYLFTDLSPSFFPEAERLFDRPGVFATAALDIARDPAAQGIATGAWDLVVAANVLHAAPDVVSALRHACSLLAPRGRLLLIEGTEISARLDITFGMTDAWTCRDDSELRPDHPLLPSERWCELLREAGLHEPLVVAEQGGQAVLTASAAPPRWLAVGHDPRLAARLGLPFLPVGAALPPAPLDGIVALVGLDGGREGLRDVATISGAVAARPEAPRLLVATRGGEAVRSGEAPHPEAAALGGFLRSLAREHPGLRPRTVDLDADDAASALAIERVLDDGEDRVAWRDSERLLARLERLPEYAAPPPAERLMADFSLMPAEMPLPGPDEVVVRVRAAGINYKDVLTAAGQLPETGSGLGGECAGEIAAIGPGVDGLAVGDAVVAVAAGALASHVRADARLVLAKPAGLDFAQAAAVPIAGVTAWYALHHLTRMRPGQRVLVQSATGGVGWFAMRLAQQQGAEIVATAGSDNKRRILADRGVREVYSSRSVDFAAAAPVDIVLGALPPEARAAALRLLRPDGHYIEIGRVGILTPAEAKAVRPDIAYHVVALDQVEAPFFAALLREVLQAVAADPSLLPPLTTLPLAAARHAFEAMMRASHVGKLVAMPAWPAAIRGDGTYVVTGGLGGLGPEIAAWLLRRGAGGVLAGARRV
ncbi:MAG: polyketide synthase dehydratase domain-containing protein, partial [Thiohalocapsa sp.]